MKLVDRLTTLMRADAHGVVDAVEDRGLLLRQHLREAEVELQRKRARGDALASEEKALEDEAARIQAKCTALDDDVSLAISEDKEELARFAIRKLLPLREIEVKLGQRRDRLKEERAELAETLVIQEQENEELKARARGFFARLEDDSDATSATFEPMVADEEVELELLRRKQQAGQEENA